LYAGRLFAREFLDILAVKGLMRPKCVGRKAFGQVIALQVLKHILGDPA